MKYNIIILGAGGHSKVIADIINKSGDCLLGFLDDHLSPGNKVLGYPVLGKIDDIYKFKNGNKFIIGIGDNNVRKMIAQKYDAVWHTAIHPSAVIAIDVKINEGTVIMANAIVNSSSKIGKHCIINSGAIVEHDNNIGNYVHISPNAALGGGVTVNDLSHIGIGANVKNGIEICHMCTVGVGAVVVRNITKSGTYIGVPVKKMR